MAKKKKQEQPARQMTRRQRSAHQKQKRRQRVIFIGGILIIVAIVAIVVVGWMLVDYIPYHRTAVKVNDVSFNMRYYIDLLKLNQMSDPNRGISVHALSVPQQIGQNELMKQAAAEEFGVEIEDKEAREYLKNLGVEPNDANIDIVKAQLLQERLKEDVFGAMVPLSDEQVDSQIMLVESESVANQVREKMLAGEDIASLADQYGLDYYSNNPPNSDYGWRPRAVLDFYIGSDIPLDFAFSGEIGVSGPLQDPEKNKQLGYWVLRVNERPDEASADVSAILAGSLDEAEEVKSRLEAGEDLAALAREYPNYSPSQEKGGELGLIVQPEQTEGETGYAISEPFDNYVFGHNTTLGKWSIVRDDTYWTKGGYWVVNVLAHEDDRELTEEDRTLLINNQYDDWLAGIWDNATVDDSALTDERRQWAIEQALDELGSGVG